VAGELTWLNVLNKRFTNPLTVSDARADTIPLMIAKLCTVSLALTFIAMAQDPVALRRDAESLNAAMVSAFKRDPGTVATCYTDDAALLGAGQRHQGRAAVDAYWRDATNFSDWKLDTLEVGGPAHTPWQYGRSVLTSRSGRVMETYFVGLLLRDASGQLKFRVDAFTRNTGSGGEADAAKVTEAWLQATAAGDARALQQIFDEHFVILSAGGARTKPQEIADLVPRPGEKLPYFRSEDTKTRGFGDLAVTTGVLKWRLQPEGREAQRHYASIVVRRPEGWKILAQQVTPMSGE
jgi:ketosteroid isomerase-like protein